MTTAQSGPLTRLLRQLRGNPAVPDISPRARELMLHRRQAKDGAGICSYHTILCAYSGDEPEKRPEEKERKRLRPRMTRSKREEDRASKARSAAAWLGRCHSGTPFALAARLTFFRGDAAVLVGVSLCKTCLNRSAEFRL